MPAIRLRFPVLAGTLAFGAVLSAPALGAASRFSPIDLHHTSWTAKDGAPSSIIAIAQTPDRWLWLASLNGIYRFDGVRFERFRPPGATLRTDIWGMRLLRSGALWIGYRSGGASVWRGGRLRTYGREDGLPASSVLDVEEDGAGRTWAATARGVYLFDGGRWAPPPPAMRPPAGECTLLADDAQAMWAQCDGGAFVLARGAPAFARVAGPVGLGRLVQGARGTVWSVGGPRGEMAPLGGPGAAASLPLWPRPRTSGGTMLFERDGRHAWVTRADGVLRVGPDGTDRAFGTANGLSGAMPNCLFQDAEGNVWVGTENGLDRFRPTLLAGVALPQIFSDSPAIAAGADGALWVGATRVARPGVAAFEALPAEREGRAVSAVLAAEPGDVWIGAQDGLWHEQGGRRERIPLPPVVRFMQFQSMTRGDDGALWITARRAGALRWRDGTWTEGGGDGRLQGDVRYVHADGRGRVWFGGGGGILRVLENGTVRSYGRAQGLDVGEILQVLDGADGTWISGLDGVVHFDGRRFMPLLGRDGEPIAAVSGIVRARGALWLNGAAGITVVEDAELARFVRDGGYRPALRRLDQKDGLRGAATTFYPVPSALAGSDGMLWFATSAGLFWLRPGGAANGLAPPVEIRALRADGADVPLSAGPATLAPNPGRVQVDYTALSLTMPERMRFLYRLDGVDRGWQEGGRTRTAEYTDLGPGRYTFRVRASNNDGVWSRQDAVIGFEVAPAYYQTAWFRLLCGAMLAGVRGGAYRLRVRRIARVVRARAEAGLQERERIARELHDTVLQTVQGLMLHVDAACQKLPPGSSARTDIERSLRLAADGVEEGRARVQGLRGAEEGGDASQPELAQHACAAVRSTLADAAARVLRARTAGRPRRLRPEVFDELAALAREAVRNAVRHAGAATITVEAEYGDAAFAITIADDGRGMAPAVLAAGGRAGHWGLPGMRERAARIGAVLTLDSTPGAGTRVAVRLAAADAYAAPRGRA